MDIEKIRELLGEQEAHSVELMKQLTEALEQAGYIRNKGDKFELTPKAMRMIGHKAMRDIFDQLKQGRFGSHQSRHYGAGVEMLEEAKRYEFGDPFFLDLQQTVLNAVTREGPGTPVRLQPADFDVYRTERQTQSSTVLMLDLSWSMARRGSFFAAKKVILALHSLIKTQFPRDSIYVVGFSTYARELKAEELPYITWDQSEPYTNMQQGLMVSQKLLSKHKHGSKQILMISDGEPTAHMERGQVYLGYPPSPRTITETLKEVQRCTHDGIVIMCSCWTAATTLRSSWIRSPRSIAAGRSIPRGYARPVCDGGLPHGQTTEDRLREPVFGYELFRRHKRGLS